MTVDGMNQLDVSRLDITNLKNEAERIAAQWNGKESGKEEDMAGVANEVVNTCNELLGLIEELSHYDYR